MDKKTASFEEEFENFMPWIKFLTGIGLFGKKILVKGHQNIIKEGGNIIVGNHIGAFKDVATILRTIPRPIFFTANYELFDKEELNILIKRHLKRHMKNFGTAIYYLLNPIKVMLVNFVTHNIGKVGTIPVDLAHHKRLAIQKCQEYVAKGRAIIALQGNGRIMKNDPFPYVHPFRRGASIISYNLFKKKGIQVPITPVAMYGTQRAMFLPGKICIDIGEPMFVTDYLEKNEEKTFQKFTEAMEQRVIDMVKDLMRTA
jgi:1-acyl-sn-glycerol-3-phosphate acyltransferase